MAMTMTMMLPPELPRRHGNANLVIKRDAKVVQNDLLRRFQASESSTWNTSYFKQASGLLQTSWPRLSDLKFKGEKDTSGWMRRKRRWIASSFWLHRPSQRLHRPSSWLDWQWLHRPCQRLQLAGLAMAASAMPTVAAGWIGNGCIGQGNGCIGQGHGCFGQGHGCFSHEIRFSN